MQMHNKLSKLLQDKMNEEMAKVFNTTLNPSTYTNQVSGNLTLESLKKAIDSIPKPPSIILSNYIPNDDKIYTMSEGLYYMHPETAKKLIKIYPNIWSLIKNKELLKEEG